MAVPVAAPALGAAILWFGDWRLIFWMIAGAALLLACWIAVRLPETQLPQDRRPIERGPIVAGWRLTLGDRLSLGYTLAAAALTGALYGYLGSIEQIMAETFGRPRLLILVFATTAATMAVANLLNARLVMRLGMRRLGHGAVLTLALVSAGHLALIVAGHENIWTFGIVQALTLACFALSTSNFSTLAMERMGHIAGTASSVQGFLALTLGSSLGIVIGRGFDGTTAPLTAGFLAAALLALAAAAVTERGKLLRPA
jgi:DHA1 family bicyclomycin/chloramphenicol resistance-like MFS transporter